MIYERNKRRDSVIYERDKRTESVVFERVGSNKEKRNIGRDESERQRESGFGGKGCKKYGHRTSSKWQREKGKVIGYRWREKYGGERQTRGAPVITCPKSSSGVSPKNGTHPTRNSYRMIPMAHQSTGLP